MTDKTGEILLSIGLLLFSVGNYFTVLSVYDLDKRVQSLRTDLQNLYRVNQYYRIRLSNLEKKISLQEESSDSDEVIELEC